MTKLELFSFVAHFFLSLVQTSNVTNNQCRQQQQNAKLSDSFTKGKYIKRNSRTRNRTIPFATKFGLLFSYISYNKFNPHFLSFYCYSHISSCLPLYRRVSKYKQNKAKILHSLIHLLVYKYML